MGIVHLRRACGGGGAQAEHVCVPAASVVPVPEGMGLVEVATVPVNGLTAKTCLDALALPLAAALLVTGSAGALGGYVVQLARNSSLRVITNASEADRDLLTSVGAGEIVPRGDRMSDAVRTRHPGGVDGLVDAALIGKWAVALVRDVGGAAPVRKSEIDAAAARESSRLACCNT